MRITGNTLKECLREPVFFLMLFSAMVLIGLFPTMSMFVFRQQLKLVVDSAMATTMLFGLFAAVLCAGHTISREMKNGTVLLLMSKPVTRFSFVISKILGILSALFLFVLICNSGTVLAVLVAKDQFRIDEGLMWIYFILLVLASLYGGFRNFHSQKSFSANATGAMTVLFPVAAAVAYVIRTKTLEYVDATEFMPAEHLIPALILIFFAVWIMGAISAALATRMEFVGNLLICLVLFLLGLIARYFMYQWFGNSMVGMTIGSLLPNWQMFWMADALTNQAQIPVTYLVWAFFYMLLYICIWAGWAIFLFEDNELAKDSR